MKYYLNAILLVCLVGTLSVASNLELDPNGYILYCPCMGRFGNQAEHFLGVLSFAHGLNKTLVLPPWVEYRPGQRNSVQIPFDTYFQVEPLQQYHRVMLMEDFMKDLAPTIWPPGNRTVFCYRSRHDSENTCNAKEGNPFGPFWDTFSIDFDDSAFYGPLHFNTHDKQNAKNWAERFPVDKFYVMAFSGAPASFPVREEDANLQKYLLWSENINNKADKFIQNNFGNDEFLGLHFRNGEDWKRACEHVIPSERHNMFASAQCLGYYLDHGQLTKELCYPPKESVLNQIKQEVKRRKVRAIFVATDSDDMKSDILKVTKKVKVVKYEPASPHVDLAILGKAHYHIGNCVSTFSAFAVRERRLNNKPVSFWAFHNSHDEL